MVDNEDYIEFEQELNKNKTMELVNLMTNLSMECDDNICGLTTMLKEAEDRLTELKQNLSEVQQLKENTANLFSPNVKISNPEDIQKEEIKAQEYIEELLKEKRRLSSIRSQMDDMIRCIHKKGKKQTDFGLNILNSNEKDRQRIARDLHDSSVQNLTGLVHKIELCTRLVDLDPIRAKLELSIMSNTVKYVINEMRDIIYDLRPMSLEDLGLISTIERYINQLKLNHDINIKVKYNKEIDGIDPVINLALYRVVQEACHNVIKHANATCIDINIVYSEKSLIISIQDNGIGFDVKKQREIKTHINSGYGLSIMKERVYLLSGTMDVKSENKKGTSITISVPLMIRKGEENEQSD